MAAKFSFGLDPEFMLSRKGKFKSAIGVIPGTKEKRHKIGKNEFYYDNVLAECAVKPANSRDEAVENIRQAIGQFALLAQPYDLTVQGSANYPTSELTHEDALKIGCDPEYCAYTLQEIRPNEDVMLNTLRSAGGHIHIGCNFAKDTNGLNKYHAIRMMDLFVGLPSVFIDTDPTTRDRKKLYGQAGRFRKPVYGVEYRTLSNFWLSSPRHVELIYDLCDFVVQFLNDGRHEKLWSIDIDRLNDDKAWNEEGFTPASCHHCTGYDVDLLRRAIDTVDKSDANRLIGFFHENVGPSLFGRYEKLATEKLPTKLYKEWNIS